jgi:predicted glutamine amidotransferase
MCRFLAYLGAPISMGELLYDPSDSIIKQSYAAREIEEPLNGDGFGVGWYHHDRSPDPAVFVSVTPAWNNRNLRYLAPKVTSHCIAAHVRAASVGDVSEANCHPFHCKDRLLMHNGGVEHFDRIKRDLCNLLSEEMFLWVKGQTDSEHLVALFLDHLRNAGEQPTPDQVADAFEAMIADLKKLMRKHAITEPAYLNMVYTDGRIAVGLRYVSDRSDALTMYYSEGKKYICTDNVCHMVRGTDKKEHAAMIVSEKLTDIADDFVEVPPHHYVLVDADLRVTLRASQA